MFTTHLTSLETCTVGECKLARDDTFFLRPTAPTIRGSLDARHRLSRHKGAPANGSEPSCQCWLASCLPPPDSSQVDHLIFLDRWMQAHTRLPRIALRATLVCPSAQWLVNIVLFPSLLLKPPTAVVTIILKWAARRRAITKDHKIDLMVKSIFWLYKKKCCSSICSRTWSCQHLATISLSRSLL